VRSYLDRRVRQLIRRGLRAGLIEGSNVWLSIGAIAWLLRFLSRRDAALVSVQELRVGESVIVSHVPAPPSTKRGRKKAARKAVALAERQAKLQAKLEASRRYQRARANAARAEAEEEETGGRIGTRPAKVERKRRVSRRSSQPRPEGEPEAPE
jgi:hypothetical protein